MLLDLSPLRKAIEQLEKSVGYLQSDLARQDAGLREQFRAATVQGFEFTYELAIRFVRRELAAAAASPDELAQLHFNDLLRKAGEAGLVRDPAAFRLYREKRNLTTHTYDARQAEEVVKGMDKFLDDVHFLLNELERRNPSQS